MSYKKIQWAASMAVVLALFVVMLGAYTRLTDAGLGCPDWPGCYGHMVLPESGAHLKEAQNQYPTIPIESRKAWTEMVHRYAAGTLALLIFFIGLTVLFKRADQDKLPWHLPLALFLLVIFQAALGMWTVTLQLLPIVVMGHLLGGILIFAGLSRFWFQISHFSGQDLPRFRPWLRLGVIIVFLQIALGGWVSSNYAGISCIGFPQCNGVWIPPLHLVDAFHLFSTIGLNYQGGVLDNEVRVTIQYVHRLGAVVTLLYILPLSVFIFVKSFTLPHLKWASVFLIFLVLLQFALGIINVIYLLPLRVAVAHNGVAALLLATLFSLLHFTRGRLPHAN